MKTLLQLNTSLFAAGGQSSQLADKFVATWKANNAEARVIVRDLASLKGEKVNYLSLLLVQNPKRQRGELRRGCRQRKEAQEALSA